MTDCKHQQVEFQCLNDCKIVADFSGGHISSDGGATLIAQLDRSYGYTKRLAECFTDYRDSRLIDHGVLELLRQRTYAIANGYEDLNDHDSIRRDPLFAAVCGKKNVTVKSLAGKSTLNRLELTKTDAGEAERYKKIVADDEAIENFFIDEWIRSLRKNTKSVTLDLDATDDIIHGNQEGRFFHGYYGNYCYLPLYIFCDDWPIVAKLRKSNIDACEGALDWIKRIIDRLRKKHPGIEVILRADSGFCRHKIMSWCEETPGVYYVFGIARNAVLERNVEKAMEEARLKSEADGGKPARVFKELLYAAGTWEDKKRRVVAKAEWTQGEANPRFIITNLKADKHPGQDLYENFYCARGNMENRIKEQQLDLFADRTSTSLMRSNQIRLWFSTLAYLLINQLRRVALKGTELAKATCGTIRLRLLKIGTLVRVSVRRIYLSMSSAFPLQDIFVKAAHRLRLC